MIKKIAVRGGHNFEAMGASALIDETTEDRKVKDALINYLKDAEYDVIDVTPGDCDVMTDLEYGVNKAEEFGADLFISIHFDKAYENYDGALGHACWIYSEGGKAQVIANNIVDTVTKGIGFKNRGVRINSKLFELRKTSMPAIIVETCFCEATDDIKLYKEKGPDLIGKLIASGISGKKNNDSKLNAATRESSDLKYAIVNTDILNVRSGAGINYPIVGQVKRGDKICLDCKINDWWSTYYGEHGGFMHSAYLTEV